MTDTTTVPTPEVTTAPVAPEVPATGMPEVQAQPETGTEAK